MHILLFLYTGAVVLVNFGCWVYTVNSSLLPIDLEKICLMEKKVPKNYDIV